MEEQGERKEEELVVADSVLEEEEEWGQQHGSLDLITAASSIVCGESAIDNLLPGSRGVPTGLQSSMK